MAEAAAAAEGESVCQCNVRVGLLKLVTNSVSVSEMLLVLVSLQSASGLESNYWTHVDIDSGRMPSIMWRRVSGVGQI